MLSNRPAADRAGCLYIVACAALAIAWMVWLGPGPGPPLFVGLPWWQWPFEAAIIGLTWFIWMLMIIAIVDVTRRLGWAIVLACVLLLIRIETALRGFPGRPRP